MLSISVKRYLFYLAGFTERRMSRANAAEIGSFFQLREKYVAGAQRARSVNDMINKGYSVTISFGKTVSNLISACHS